MSIDFFGEACKEPSRTDKRIGICDGENEDIAYSTIASPETWVAVVKNDSEIEVTFTAIDHCTIVYKEGKKEKESTCDGMLTFADTLYLVELKEVEKNWITDAIGQLESTINLMKKHSDLAPYKYKKAFACNKKHPHFATINNETNTRFYREHGFRIDVQAEILIK